MDDFARFVTDHQGDLKRIASHTRGEHSVDDVVSEAWLMARQLRADDPLAFDMLQSASRQRLLSHLYQHLVRYAELNVRHAVRLDHSTRGDPEESAAHPLMNMLASDGGNEPLTHLLDLEQIAAAHADTRLQSLAGAYVLLLRRFDNRMRDVADHLLISLSYAYRRCAQARWLAHHQTAIALDMPDGDAMLGPWRRCRYLRVPVQMTFSFDDAALFADLDSAHQHR